MAGAIKNINAMFVQYLESGKQEAVTAVLENRSAWSKKYEDE